ncbi:MAG: AraC family transcriptional regulator [Bacteroidota bacterium]
MKKQSPPKITFIMNRENAITALAHQSAVNKAIDYIENNICDKIELDSIAQVANLSKFHFLRIFKTLIGETPLQFIMRLRLEKIASSLLSKPNDSITSIANEFGFTDITAFSKNFKIQFGTTASNWRINNSNLNQIESNNTPTNNKSVEYFCNHAKSVKLETKMVQNKSIEVKDIKQFSVVYYRHLGSYVRNDNLHEKMWSKLVAWATPKGYLNNPDLKTLVVYHDDPNLTNAEKQRMSFCISIPDNAKVDNKIDKMIIEGGKYLVAHFELKSTEFILAWDWVMKWLPTSGYEPDSKYCFEMYSEEPKNGLFGIDIHIPIRVY